ncbi:ATP-binding protein, partial [Kitasatospora sp. P5_F3]
MAVSQVAVGAWQAVELVGREWERLALVGRLRDPSVRLLTLTGPGGVGKSRLVRAVRPELAELFGEPGYADLSTVGSPAEAAAAAVRASDLAGDRRLLVLEGCEHHGGPLGTAVAELLRRDDRLVVLATGQQPLRVYGERLFPVAPLPVPPAGDDPEELREVASVELFVRRAREANPAFALTAENARAVAELCGLLEGLPLALELAARQLRLHTPHDLLDRLRRRGVALGGGPFDAPERHRSLAALAAWSCRGLGPEPRVLLEQLACFPGGFTAATAERLGPADLDVLLDRGLVVQLPTLPGHPRLTVPEPIRSYARAALADDGREQAALDRQTAECRRLLAAAEPRLSGTEQSRWLDAVQAEHPNVLAALDRLRERGEPEATAAALLACRLPWLTRGHLREGLTRADRAATEAVPEPVRARLLELSGAFAAALGDPAGAVRRQRAALAAGRPLGDRRLNALLAARLGGALRRLDDLAGAETALGPALETLESLGAAGAAVEAGTELARVLLARGERQRAAELLDRAVAAARRIGDARALAGALGVLARTAEEPAAAGQALRECLRLYGTIGERTELPAALEDFALHLLRAAPVQQPRAAGLLAAAETLRDELGSALDGPRRAELDDALDGLRDRLRPNGFAVAWAEGRRLSPAAAVAEALAAPDLARRAAAP